MTERGLEYTGDQLRENLRRGHTAGLADLLLDFPPGFFKELGMPKPILHARASGYRAQGIKLKKMPGGPRRLDVEEGQLAGSPRLRGDRLHGNIAVRGGRPR